MTHLLTKSLIKAVLQQATSYKWSIQGFGMLRLHMDDVVRLNVWDERYMVPNVSLIHTHPWHFESWVVAGALWNHKYTVSEMPGDAMYHFSHIKPGPGGGVLGETNTCRLHKAIGELVRGGDQYSQQYDEIHRSEPTNGTVTINRRRRVGDDIAYTYWPVGTEWVSAEPRDATNEEVLDITQASLNRWFA